MPTQKPDQFPYEELAPGIRNTVRWVHELGYETSDSGDGVANQHAGMECSNAWLGVPMVAITVDPYRLRVEADRLWITVLDMAGGKSVDPVRIEASYDPHSQVGIILLTGLDDKLLHHWRAEVG
jgi:hypothetical protein